MGEVVNLNLGAMNIDSINTKTKSNCVCLSEKR